MRKKVPILLASLLCMMTLGHAVAATSENQINVEFASGDVVTFTLDQTPRITYTDTEVTVTYTGGTLVYGMTEIKKLTLGSDKATGIENLQATKTIGRISCVGGQFRFEGFPEGSLVRLFNLSGQLVQSASVVGEGTSDASFDELPAGTYVITVKGQTYKFNKR